MFCISDCLCYGVCFRSYIVVLFPPIFFVYRCRATVEHGMCAYVCKPGDDGHVHRPKMFIDICFASNYLHASLSKLIFCRHFPASHHLRHHSTASAIRKPLSASCPGRRPLRTSFQSRFKHVYLRQNRTASDGWISVLLSWHLIYPCHHSSNMWKIRFT